MSSLIPAGRAVFLAVVVAIATLALAAPESGFGQGAKDGPADEVRTAGICSGGAKSGLRLRAEDGAIELRFEVDRARVAGVWRVALVHERRVAWRGSAGKTRSSSSFRVEKALPDLPGYDTVTVRAWGPAGLACRATATLAGS